MDVFLGSDGKSENLRRDARVLQLLKVPEVSCTRRDSSSDLRPCAGTVACDLCSLLRARAHSPTLLSHTHRSEPRSPPGHEPAPPEPLPAAVAPSPPARGVGAGRRRGQGDQKPAGTRLSPKRTPGGFGASLRGHREKRAGRGAQRSLRGPG